MRIGEYVLATKFSDGDPQDQWCVGFYNRKLMERNLVIDNAGKNFRANGFRKIMRITQAEGKYLVDHIKDIEESGNGLWKILWSLRRPKST